MFQCTHPAAKLMRSTAFDQMNKYCHQHSLPAEVYIPFVNMCKAVCNDKPPNTTRNITPIVSQAMKQQMQLPPEFLLRGYLVKEWYDTLFKSSNDDADKWMTRLHLGAWNILFTQVWDLRNKQNHSSESITDAYERRLLKAELKEWKQTRSIRLGAHQSYLAEYDLTEVMRQPTSSLKTTIDILTIAARNWRKASKSGQKLITKYFKPNNSNNNS